jgi:hypothetical protein
MNDVEQRPLWIRLTKRLLSWVMVLAFALLCWGYSKLVASLLLAKSNARKSPELWNVPQPLHLESSLPTAGRTLCYLGYQFQSPWTEITVERKYKELVALTFSGGQGIAIWDQSKTLDDRTMAGQPEN